MTPSPTRPVDNVVIATKGLQDRNINIIAGTTVENKGKLILSYREVYETKVAVINSELYTKIIELKSLTNKTFILCNMYCE